MKAPAFRYHRIHDLTELFDALDAEGDDAAILAGGQSLMALLNMRLAMPGVLLDIGGLTELAGVRDDGTHLAVGALTRHCQVMADPLIAAHAPLIAAAMPHIAHPAIRNRGTFGGSVALADPSAELPACCVALDAEIVLRSRAGDRAVAANEFFKGIYETDLRAGEILTEVRIPKARAGARTGFQEITRRRGDYAMAGLAATGTPKDKHLDGLRLVYFGVGPRPTRLLELEEMVAEGALDEGAALLAEQLDPPDDPLVSGAMRKHLAGVLLRRVVGPMLEGIR